MILKLRFNNNILSDRIMGLFVHFNCLHCDPQSTGFDLVKRKKAFICVYIQNCIFLPLKQNLARIRVFSWIQEEKQNKQPLSQEAKFRN